jgi:polygalacturonase
MRSRIKGAAVIAAVTLAGCRQEPTAARNDRDGLTLESPSRTSAVANRVVFVDDDAAPSGDGSSRTPFRSLSEAVAAINGSGGGTIIVAPGVYLVTTTIRLEKPVNIRGSNVALANSDGWPSGALLDGTETRIVGTSALGTTTTIVAGKADGTVLNNVTISNLTIETFAGGGNGLDIIKTQGFTVRDNIIRGGGLFGLTTIASSGRVSSNYITGVSCGACIGAGNPGSPATVDIIGNRIVSNRLGGLLLNGSGTAIPELADQLNATVTRNDLSHNKATPRFSFGLRLFVIRQDLGGPFDLQSTGHVSAVVRENRIDDNEVGILLDAGFPFRRVGSVIDTRQYTGTFDLSLRGNTVSNSNLTPAAITFTRVNAAFNQSLLNLWQYLYHSTYTIDDPDGSMAGVWIDHPSHDPISGAPLDNHIVINGIEAANGRTFP